jgi:hypothetical protein
LHFVPITELETKSTKDTERNRRRNFVQEAQ